MSEIDKLFEDYEPQRARITKEDWFPKHEPLEYPDEFVEWIDSINRDFRDRIKYRPFEMWKKQAMNWLKDTDTISSYKDADAQTDFIIREFNRCRDNTLYFANKYGYLKEGDDSAGKIKFKAFEAQEIVMFLFDCGYNVMLGKPRQVGFSSVMGICANKRINFNKSYFVKFITHSREKGEEIFRDKIKNAFSEIETWLKQDVYNDTGSELNLATKDEKGVIGGFNSRIVVSSPAVDAINGGSPNLVLIDEIGLFTIFGKMMREGRPALFYFDPHTKKMRMKRQIICWGTGGDMGSGGAIFKEEFLNALKAWRKRDFHYGIIPIFFNAYARMGLTKELFDKEKNTYYSTQGVDAEFTRVQFHQAYPMTIDDMFLSSARTLVPVNKLNQKLLDIYQLPVKQKPQYGYFHPIYDMTQPNSDGAPLPYKLIGSEWRPVDHWDDPRATAVVFRKPEKNWVHRYYQGTDPINTETGSSKMSSAIWDAYENTVSAVVFDRKRDFKQTYLQCVLLSIYYEQPHGTRELIESNIGDHYVDFKDSIGYGKNIAANTVLPKHMHTPGKWWGISNRSNTGEKIIHHLIDLLDTYFDNIYIEWLFVQLKTFVEKGLAGAANPKNITQKYSSERTTRYQAADLRFDRDDVIFAVTFAYLNALCHAKHDPMEISDDKKRSTVTRRFVQTAETNWQLRLAEVNEEGKIVRFIGHRS